MENGSGRYFVGLDLGQTRDHSALDVDQLRKVTSQQPLAELVELAAQDAAPLAVTDSSGVVVGIVDRQALLEGLRKGA